MFSKLRRTISFPGGGYMLTRVYRPPPVDESCQSPVGAFGTLFPLVIMCTSVSAQSTKISWDRTVLDIAVLSGTVRATAVQFSSTRALNDLSCSICWAHRVWERWRQPVPRWHAPGSMRR
jgi:hypothetical protein